MYDGFNDYINPQRCPSPSEGQIFAKNGLEKRAVKK
jgi:hypothetical protein